MLQLGTCEKGTKMKLHSQAKPEPVAGVVMIAGIVLESAEAIKAEQDEIKGHLTSLDKRVHANAVQCLMHAAEYGDTSLLRRLLIDTIDEVSGYRRQGLLNWVFKFSPCRLTKDTVNLSGDLTLQMKDALIKQFEDTDTPIDEAVMIVGDRAPFLIEQADATPFWTDADNAERVAKPVFRDDVLAQVDRASKALRNALANTNEDGEPIDPKKPHWEGKHSAEVVKLFDDFNAGRAKLPADNTKELVTSAQELEKARRRYDEAASKVA